MSEAAQMAPTSPFRDALRRIADPGPSFRPGAAGDCRSVAPRRVFAAMAEIATIRLPGPRDRRGARAGSGRHRSAITTRSMGEPSSSRAIGLPLCPAVWPWQGDRAVVKETSGSVRGGLAGRPILHEEERIPGSAAAAGAAGGRDRHQLVGIERLKQGECRLTRVLRPEVLTDALLPFEDFIVMRVGQIEESEKARPRRKRAGRDCLDRTTPAVQVVLDRQRAEVQAGDQRAQATYRSTRPTIRRSG